MKSQTIVRALPHVLKTVDYPALGTKFQGKVRDFYMRGDQRIIVTTDRQSAFDVVLGHIPFKGAVLNLLSAFWFEKTKHIVPNHLLSVPDMNVSIVRNLTPIPVEMIVRGYISGSTKTSIWYSYQQGERTIYGIQFPDGLVKNQKLTTPVITPTTHGGGKGGHDERLTREEIIKRKIVSPKVYAQMEKAALALFSYGSALCKRRGLILVDTKYEFGLYKGHLMLMDEVHTPDSSRFWKVSSYRARLKQGLEPENFDKEFLRLWYAKQGYRGDGVPPKMTQSLIVATSRRYIDVYEKITGKKFTGYSYPAEDRIQRAIAPRTYEESGVRYDIMDALKRAAQKSGVKTAKKFSVIGGREVSASRGESAYVWEEKDSYRACVMEGLGTKNLVADALYPITGKTYYDSLAQDTVAMIVNDLIVVGAIPTVVNAYFAVGDSRWFSDKKRTTDLIRGWAAACRMSGAVWGGGETATLQGIITSETIDLAGSAVGRIYPKNRLTTGDKITVGDAIVLVESSGIHANGLTLARKIAGQLPKGYKTHVSGGVLYGEALLKPTHIYAALVSDIFDAGVAIHYMVHITGHGWRKLMRAERPFTYFIDTPGMPQPLFSFIQKHAGISEREMYGTFNMGAGFAVYLPKKDAARAVRIAEKHHMHAWIAGHIEQGKKQVVIRPKNIVFSSDTLTIR